jgi:hypothetical protein
LFSNYFKFSRFSAPLCTIEKVESYLKSVTGGGGCRRMRGRRRRKEKRKRGRRG